MNKRKLTGIGLIAGCVVPPIVYGAIHSMPAIFFVLGVIALCAVPATIITYGIHLITEPKR